MEIKLEQLIDKCSDKDCPLLPIVNRLIERVKELEAKLNMDSSNSSKPPSTDGLKRNNTKSLREKSDKKQGGQSGHKGSTLEMTDTPDYVETHLPKVCSCCGESLAHGKETSTEKRQVIDIIITTYTTEHRALTKKCLICNTNTKASFPQGIENNVQYGNSVKALSAYMTEQQLIPYERAAEFFSEIFGINLSEATIVNNNNNLYELLKPAEDKVKELLLNSYLVHKDETGIFINGKLNWLHGTSTDKATYYQSHSKRGSTAMDEDRFMSLYKGIVVHDFWKPYFNYSDIIHALCNAHLLRELKAVHENNGEEWADNLFKLLIEINGVVSETKENGFSELPSERYKSFHANYDRLLENGFQLNPVAEKKEKTRGKAKQSKSFNLLRRLRDYKDDILRFMIDFKVPFTNNQAERDIRMVKVKQKISGTFRSIQGAKTFCRIRAYISTVKKNGASIFQEIQNAFLGNPFIPYSA